MKIHFTQAAPSDLTDKAVSAELQAIGKINSRNQEIAVPYKIGDETVVYTYHSLADGRITWTYTGPIEYFLRGSAKPRFLSLHSKLTYIWADGAEGTFRGEDCVEQYDREQSRNAENFGQVPMLGRMWRGLTRFYDHMEVRAERT